jgi:eukaryotic-like serine/threonine-protein kinase
MFQIGEKFGDYEVLQILGAGGMGQVYKVRNTISDRFEAMKVLLPNLEQHTDLADRFLREIKVQATLQHKNIAGLHTAHRQTDRILMFIEFVDGITLDKALQRGPLAPELAANIIGQVLEALQYAHSRGIVHRDIKPENIMVQPDGTVKLMDFGIARLAQDRRLTGTGRTVGSLFYMSPEQIRGADDLDHRSDLYSLGITLYQCVTGKRPFDGDSDYSIMSAHIQQVPPPPVQLDSRVPAALNDAIMMAIAKDRGARFQSADAFRAALLGSVGGGTPQQASVVPAPPPRTATEPLPAAKPVEAATMLMSQTPPAPVSAAGHPAASPSSALSASKKSGAGMWIGAGVLLAAVSLGGGAYFSGRLGSSTPPAKDPIQTTEPVIPAKDPPVVVSRQPEPTPPATKKPQPKVDVVKQVQTVPPLPPPQSRREPADPVPAPVTQPARSNYQQPLAQTDPAPAKPAVDPQVQREMEELRQKFNSLSTRFASAQESVRGLELQQQRQGLGMRRDVREGIQRFQYLMKESADSLTSRNTEAAQTSLNMAERVLERLEKFLGN